MVCDIEVGDTFLKDEEVFMLVEILKKEKYSIINISRGTSYLNGYPMDTLVEHIHKNGFSKTKKITTDIRRE